MPPHGWPALWLGVGALAVLVAELALPARRQTVLPVCAGLAAVVLAGSLWLAGQAPVDGFTRLVFGLVALAAAAALVLAWPQLDPGEPAAFVALVLLAACGMGVLASSTSWPALFVGLELLSLSLYVLVAYRREDRAAQEGAFKYFVLGSAASGLLLLGIALVYGSTGTLAFPREPVPASGPGGSLAAAGFALVVVGLAFKLALVPFHFWAPDAYQAGTLGVTAFMAVATKAAAFAALARVVRVAPGAVLPALWGLAVASMLAGSLGALRQRDFRRLMAYSGMANAGYLLMALVDRSPQSMTAAAVYLAAYAAMTTGLFAVAALAEAATPAGAGPLNRAGVEEVARRAAAHPAAPWLMVLFLAGLTGLPVTGGFVGKVLLLRSALQAQATGLALSLVASTAILAYPYWKLAYRALRPGREGALGEPGEPAAGAVGVAGQPGLPAGVAGSQGAPGLSAARPAVVRAWLALGWACALVTVALGVMPPWLMR
ncbi:MAG TPA: proton-conducting transporter membrane subunit [Limnochordales bacterium]